MISFDSTSKKDNSGHTVSEQLNTKRRCIYCGQQAQIVWVHGHGQCAACGINVDECCRGENCTFD